MKNNKQCLRIFILAISFILAGCQQYPPEHYQEASTPISDDNQLSYRVCSLHFSNKVVLTDIPLAETQEQQTKGLSGRLDIGQGMLFRFPYPEQLTFWMRNTLVPLSIGFFDEQGRLFKIEEMQANTDDLHFSGQEAIDALELPQGQFQTLGLPVGTKLLERRCSEKQ